MAYLTIMIILRLYEAMVLGNIYHFPTHSLHFELIGLQYDLLIFLKTCAILVIPFSLLYLVKPRIAEVFFLAITSMLVIISLVLQHYFANSMIPLGSDLFAYSIAEIKHTVGASGAMSILSLLPFVIFITLLIFLHLLFKKIIFPAWILYLFYLSFILTIILNRNSCPDPKNFKTDFESFLACNKLGFFSSNSLDYFQKIREERQLLSNLNGNPSLFTDPSKYSFHYVSKDYPLLHTDETADVLGNFFKTGKKAPNFVFIIVESLGRAYCGDNAYLGSFTPYLDSLMRQSLYWENFLSTGGRTFAILPSTFGSLPYGENGFAEMGKKMPKHLSLIKLLRDRGYYASFLYGGDAHFDLMDAFLQRQRIDQIIDAKSFGSGYTKLPANDGGFTWGYGDKEIFRKLLEISKPTSEKPRLDIVLTLAMHSPFKIINQEYYDQKFENRLKTLKLSETDKIERRNYAKQYATMLYFDDALRSLIKEYSKREDFKNTIFIITGDHRMPEIPISTQLDRFHVPLVIYSPLLKKAARFSSISTQFDITPSIIAFMRENYGMKFSPYAHWIGYGIDTLRTFRNIHSYALMRNKNELTDYIDGTYFLSNNGLNIISPTLDIETINDMNRQEEIQMKFNNFKTINTFVCAQNRIVPDSVYSYTYTSVVKPNKPPKKKTISK